VRGSFIAARRLGSFSVSNRKKPWKGRASAARSRGKSVQDVFEQSLRGDADEPRQIFDPRADRKTLQLCRQVQRALMLALAGECADDLLREVSVDGVQPVDGAGHLLVRVHVPADLSVLDVLLRLNERAGKLRAVVAGSICRKRVPMLSFAAAAEGGFHE
jgi:hypothetical protein